MLETILKQEEEAWKDSDLILLINAKNTLTEYVINEEVVSKIVIKNFYTYN